MRNPAKIHETHHKKKLPSSDYKGVVPQPNGRWGAQLYNGHKRVWLGTFDHQHQAAVSHDLAAIRFRGVRSAANFPPQHYLDNPIHLSFLFSCSLVQLVNMLRTHTYHDELARFLRTRTRKPAHTSNKRFLFHKVLTASDIGRGTLHRLVVPKREAEREFPSLKMKKGMTTTLSFEDGGGGRVWKFKYCYWKDSKNYVLTRGWTRFVKDKGLKPGDLVSFYASQDPHKWLYIDATRRVRVRARMMILVAMAMEVVSLPSAYLGSTLEFVYRRVWGDHRVN